MKFLIATCLFYLSLLCRQVRCAGPIQGFLQTNVVGYPVLHEKQNWIFDPSVSERRRRQFEEIHGPKGERLIERLGLGIDGYENAQKRLQLQRIRDQGHLGGLNYFLP